MIKWVDEIKSVPLVRKYAQFCEENIFDFILANIGITNKYLLDIGAGGLGGGMSNTQSMILDGWEGLRMDGNNHGEESIKKEWITTENIVELLSKYSVPKEFDFLSIDIDGNDFWVLKNILENYSPRIIVNEFNGCIPNGVSKSMANNPAHQWGHNDYYGASFDAFKKLLNGQGYTLIYQVASTNMISVRSAIIPDHDYGVTYEAAQYHAHAPGQEWVEV